MKKEIAKNRVLCLLLTMLLFLVAVTGIYDFAIPSSVTVTDSNSLQNAVFMPFASVSLDEEMNGQVLSQNTETQPVVGHVLLFNSIPLKEITVTVSDRRMLIPGGMTFGVKLFTKGVLLAGISNVEADGKRYSPAADAGLQVQDLIIRINGSEVNTVEDITDSILQSNGATLTVTVLRDGQEIDCRLTPILCGENGYKAGIWIRDHTAGIGTVTYIDPDTQSFAGLGHGICDVDTGMLLPMRYGIISGAMITGIVRGQIGTPGEFKGCFTGNHIGTLTANTRCGVYGTFTELPQAAVCEAIPIAFKSEVKAGDAEILCCNSDNQICRYQVKLSDISQGQEETRNFVIEVTDPALLEMTGGIVQGMSGSPIIQNGRLVGAVTHVLVNDPTKGYGIFIENMLKNAA